MLLTDVFAGEITIKAKFTIEVMTRSLGFFQFLRELINFCTATTPSSK
jgi:hypothetical protein